MLAKMQISGPSLCFTELEMDIYDNQRGLGISYILVFMTWFQHWFQIFYSFCNSKSISTFNMEFIPKHSYTFCFSFPNCHMKRPDWVVLKSAIDIVTILEVKNPRSRWQQMWFLLSLSVCKWHLSLCPRLTSSVDMKILCVSSVSCKGTRHVGLRTTLKVSF